MRYSVRTEEETETGSLSDLLETNIKDHNKKIRPLELGHNL